MKIGIATLFTGYNYGSALQAYATKEVLRRLGYSSEILKVKGSLVKGRDVRLKKTLVILTRALRHLRWQGLKAYASNMSKPLSHETQVAFESFKDTYICPIEYSWRELKKIAKSDEYQAFLCGSDQIWNGDALYVDPFYYLRFAPQKKRIAFAPSLGRAYIADENQKVMKRYISEIPYLSVRENSAADVIEAHLGKRPQVLLDPTLLLDREAWLTSLDLQALASPVDEPYVLAYFLDEPSDKAKRQLRSYMGNGYRVLALPYNHEADWFNECLRAGPRDFLRYLLHASAVCTDSFHGVAFSINFNKEFYCFERQYGPGQNQSTRILSLLNMTRLMDRFEVEEYAPSFPDYSFCNHVLKEERIKACVYVREALEGIKEEAF